MKMTILRGQKALEMDVDFEHETVIGNIDYDDGYMTLYGTETTKGELYYVILDKEATSTVRSLDGPNTVLSVKELFALGNAYGSFSVGEIDQGIHLVLPMRNVEDGVWDNKVFQELVDVYFYDIDYPEGWISEFPKMYPNDQLGTMYMGAIKKWAKDNGVDI